MPQLLMRFLLLNSLIAILSGCSTMYRQLKTVAANPMQITRLQPAFGVGVYKTSVDVTGRHLSGLLVIKKMPDSSVRVVFTSEMGFTYFDFQWPDAGDFAVNSIIKQLDQPAVITTLRKDFEGILMNRLRESNASVRTDGKYLYNIFSRRKDYYNYITDSAYQSLIKLERAGRRKKVVTIYMDATPDHIPDSIHIVHHNFSFDIKLKKLRRDVNE